MFACSVHSYINDLPRPMESMNRKIKLVHSMLFHNTKKMRLCFYMLYHSYMGVTVSFFLQSCLSLGGGGGDGHTRGLARQGWTGGGGHRRDQCLC